MTLTNPSICLRIVAVFVAAIVSSLFGPLSRNAWGASAGCTASANGVAFTVVNEFRKILVAQPFSAGERFTITFTAYANAGGPANKNMNVGQGDGFGNANGSSFANFLVSGPATFGPFTVPGGGITQLSMSIFAGQGIMNASGSMTCLSAAPPSTPSPGPPPVLSNIPDQTIPQNGSVTVPFTISGAIIPAALRVSVSSSNTTMLPVSQGTLSVTCDGGGSCALRIAPADGRGGVGTVTLTATDGTFSDSTSFTVRVTVIRPTAPPVLLANVVGSGVVLTWAEPDTGMPAAYAIAWGTSSAASDLPVQLVPGTVGRLEFSSLPIGTYHFRVYAVGAGDLSPASPPHSATVTTGAAPGPPLALQAATSGTGIASSWRAPSFGTTPTLYEIHVGSGLGLNDIASATTAAISYDAPAGAGTYWVRSRAASGGAVGAWSNSVQIPVGSAPCMSAPPTPTLLPVTLVSGGAIFTWWAGGGSTADHYEVQISTGLTAVGTAATRGAGTSLLWPHVGTFAARLVAVNACGASPPSNQMAFTSQP